MNRYYLSVITGYNSPNFCGMSPFTVEADGFEYGTSGTCRFWSRVGEPNDMGISRTETIAIYPISRTIIKKIEKIKENG